MKPRPTHVLTSILALALAGCSATLSGASPLPTSSDSGPAAQTESPDPSGLDSLDDPEGPIQTPLQVSLVKATNCNPGLVPQASPPAGPNAAPSPPLQLRVPILMYHRVLPPGARVDSVAGLIVPEPEFDAQLAAMSKAGWTSMTMADLARYLQNGTPAPPKTFAITLDDGHFDSYQYALPILEKWQFNATFFVVVGRIGHPDNMTADQVADLPRHGMEVGNHTVDHLSLAGRKPDSLTYEIDTAEATLAAITGDWPVSFAYPRGRWDTGAVAAIRACSPILTAVVEGRGSPELWADRFTLRRIEVGPGRTPEALLAEVERAAGR